MDPLASFEDLQKLSREQWTDADTERATSLLGAASTLVRSYCGWEISAFTDAVVTLDGPGGRVLALPCLYVTDVATVELLDTSGLVTATLDDFVPSAGSGLIHRRYGRRWPAEYSSIRVTYSGGYDPAPADVMAVVVSAVDRARTTPSGGMTQEQTGQVMRAYSPTAAPGITLSATERLALGDYRITRES